MSMFPHTVTVYNKYIEGGAERWRRTVLRGVFWNANRGAVLRRTGAASAGSVTLLIPRSIAEGASYRGPIAWAGLTDKSGLWTLQAGDTVVKGALAVEIVRSAAKELAGYDDVLIISNVDGKPFGGGMAHWEVTGK